MDGLKKLINTIDELPMLYKYLLCIPLVSIVWSIYRLARSIVANDMVGIVVNAIIIIFSIVPFFWLIDLICLLVNGKVWSLD